MIKLPDIYAHPGITQKSRSTPDSQTAFPSRTSQPVRSASANTTEPIPPASLRCGRPPSLLFFVTVVDIIEMGVRRHFAFYAGLHCLCHFRTIAFPIDNKYQSIHRWQPST
ncbi:MAG: hypothetical protein K0Q59_5719 [Paenibacillus sp.]|nr:hypothetical protein [Paenibacillus sp.]